MKALKFLMASSAAYALAIPQFAMAQESVAKPNPQNDEIVVTALRSETKLQTTPVAVTVVSDEALTAAGVTDMRGLEAIAPTLNVRTDTVFTQFTLRGVGSTGTSEIGDAAITLSIDGEPLTRPIALNTSLMDVQRIEVLSGPQGTLYGRNATAGAINVVTKKPEFDFGAGGSVEVGNYSAFNTQGYVNIPLSDTLATRVAFMRASHDGYLRHSATLRSDDQNVWGVRGSLLFKPSSSFKLLVAVDHSEVDQFSTLAFGVNPATLPAILAQNGGTSTPNTVGVAPGAFTPTFDKDGWPLQSVGFLDVEQTGVRAQADLDLGGATLTYFGSYRDINSSGMQPLTGQPTDNANYHNARLNYDTLTQELRLSGETNGGLNWQTGVFYFNEKTDLARGAYLPNTTANPAATPPTAAQRYLNFFNFGVKFESIAVYGQATVPLTDRLNFSVGSRYNWDDKVRTGLQCLGVCVASTFGYPNHPTIANGGVLPGAINNSSDRKFTWMANFDYEISDDSFLYAKVSTGYKAGGFDNIGTYEPESITAYEIGSKNRLLDRRLQLNLTGFYYDYSNLQTTLFISSLVGSRTVNVSNSRNYGLEAEMRFQASDNTRVNLSVNYLDAKYTNFSTNQARLFYSNPASPTYNVNLAGNRPIQSPKLTILYGLEQDLPINDGKFTFAVSGRYRSSYFTSVDNFQADRQKAFTNTDLSLAYTPNNDRWKATIFVRNIEDYRPLGFTGYNGVLQTYNFILAGAPRTFGGRVEFKF